jgi:predicted MFS family arabinose efflux permease
MSENTAINIKYPDKTTKNEPKKTRGKLIEYDSLINMADRSFHSMGQTFITDETILPLYISNFTSSGVVIGLIPFIQALFFSVPQLFTLAKPIKRFKTQKGVIIFFGILERLPLLILGIITLFVDNISPVLLLLCFFLLYTVSMASWGYPLPLWFDFIKKTVNSQITGSFFGTSLILKNLFGFWGGILLALLLSRFSYPYNYSYAFFTGFIIMSISLIFFSLNKKPIKYEINPESSSEAPETISSLFSILRDDTEFLFLSLSFIFSTMLFTTVPFFSVFAKVKFNILGVSEGILTAVFFLGHTVGGILGGHLSNKHDYKKLMVLSIISGITTIFIVMFASAINVYYASFFFVGFSQCSQKLAFLAYILSDSVNNKSSAYIAIGNNIIMPFQILFPLLGGLIVDYLSYSILFVFCFFFLILSFFSFTVGITKFSELVQNRPNQ